MSVNAYQIPAPGIVCCSMLSLRDHSSGADMYSTINTSLDNSVLALLRLRFSESNVLCFTRYKITSSPLKKLNNVNH